MVEAMASRITDLQKELAESRKRAAAVTTPHTDVTAPGPAAKKTKAAAPAANSAMVRKRLVSGLKQALKGQKFFNHYTLPAYPLHATESVLRTLT